MFHFWQQLAGNDGSKLLEMAEEIKNLNDVANVAQLRKHGSAKLVHCAIALVLAREKAAQKFPADIAAQMWADVVGIEQATSLDIAQHKARRFKEYGCDAIVDMCCGIGGDALALSQVAEVMCIDLDPSKAWMAHRNCGAPAAAADVTTLAMDGRAFHIDPDRRGDGRRRWSYDQMQPGPEFIEQLAHMNGAVKLSPGVDAEALPEGELEMIQRHGTLTQAVLWVGSLAGATRRATCMDSGATLSGEPDQDYDLSEPKKYLYTISPAIERSRLVGLLADQTNLTLLHPALGIMTSEQLVQSPWLMPFELVEVMSFRESRVKQWLKANDGGVVEIKTRGKAVEPDSLQQRLRGEGATQWTLFILRLDQQVNTYITRRVEKTLPTDQQQGMMTP